MKTKTKILAIALLATTFLFTGCTKEGDNEGSNQEEGLVSSVTVNDFVVTIPEDVVVGQSIGFVQATGVNGVVSYGLNGGNELFSSLALDQATGELTITSTALLDFENKVTYTGEGEVSIVGKSETRKGFSITIHLTDVVELNVQQRLDVGETPSQIYNSDNTYLDSLYGKTYVGGLIFYFDITDGSGLLSAKNDQSISMVWDPNTSGLVATTATSTAIGDGAQNTFVITTSIGVGTYAARECGDLVLFSYTGWYLPTLDELEEMYDVLHANGLGNFQNAKYWTSSELSAGSAWYRDFAVSSGQTAASALKIDTYAVRAIRTF